VDADPDDNAYNFFITDGPWNTNGWTNTECDRLLAAERATSDQDERRQIFQDLQRLLQAECPMPFLYHTDDITGFHTYVKGYKPIPEMRYLESVWLDQ
jgi:ABC-type transport system substrate-binding protein